MGILESINKKLAVMGESYDELKPFLFSKKERQHKCRLSSYCSKIFVLVHFQFLSLLVNIVHFSVHLLEKIFRL